MITLSTYDLLWPGQFLFLKTQMMASLSAYVLSIEHIGSTAVAGLTAKPIIDLDIVVGQEEHKQAISDLARMGYQHRGDLGIPQREAFVAPWGPISHHVYVCPPESVALANHLAVRDFLRNHPEAARQYGELKVRLAEKHPDDIDAYVEGKSEFLLKILAQCGFQAEQLTDIWRVNQKDREALGRSEGAKQR